MLISRLRWSINCYEKELKAYWIILCVIQWEENAFVKYGRRAFTQSLVFNPGAYLSDEQVRDIAEKNGWKYVEYPGEVKTCDITSIFNSSSLGSAIFSRNGLISGKLQTKIIYRKFSTSGKISELPEKAGQEGLIIFKGIWMMWTAILGDRLWNKTLLWSAVLEMSSHS